MLIILPVNAAPPPGTSDANQVMASRIRDCSEYINANKLLMFCSNVGSFAEDLDLIFSKRDGLYYPYQSIDAIENGPFNRTVIYAAGLWLGGKVNGETRVAVAEYTDEFGPGPMTAGGSYQPWALEDPAFRVYKLYRDSLESNPNTDYIQWPAGQGAPVDGNGYPQMRGDQMPWTVYNDADPSLHTEHAGSTAPLGVEIQQRIWAMDEDGYDSLWSTDQIAVQHHGDSRAWVSVEVVDPGAVTGHDYMVVTLGLASPTVPIWELHDVTLGTYQTFSQTEATVDGLLITVSMASPRIGSWEWGPDPELRCLSGVDWGGSNFFGGIGSGWEFLGTSLNDDEYVPILIRWEADGYGQSAYCYRRDLGYNYDGYHPNQNITAWDISSFPARQVNFAFVEYYDPAEAAGQNADSIWNPGEQVNMGGTANDLGGREYLFILNSDYSPVENPTYAVDYACFGPPDAEFDCLVAGWVRSRDDVPGSPGEGEYLRLYPEPYEIANDTFTFTGELAPLITTGPDGVSIYIEYKLYNLGGNTINDCYISLWSDPDLGLAGDDLVGCDTILDLHYCYNGEPWDDIYYDSPPSAGYKLLYGPIVPSPFDTAYFDGQPIIDHKNLGMTALSSYINGTDPQSAYETYNCMQGLLRDGTPYTWDSQILTYHHSGNPMTQTGDLDTGPADRRMMCSMGPFTFNPGDSQYVLVKFAVGQGDDYLSSIGKLMEILTLPFEFPSCCLNRGDLNHSDGPIPADISDLTYIVDYIFGGGPPPVCYAEGDLNASGYVDITDLTYLVDFIFGGGPPGLPCD